MTLLSETAAPLLVITTGNFQCLCWSFASSVVMWVISYCKLQISGWWSVNEASGSMIHVQMKIITVFMTLKASNQLSCCEAKHNKHRRCSPWEWKLQCTKMTLLFGMHFHICVWGKALLQIGTLLWRVFYVKQITLFKVAEGFIFMHALSQE